METYRNLSGKSNVSAYEIGIKSITVEFKSGNERFYLYTYNSCGADNVEHMKILAKQGEGLNSFIMLNVKNDYESKW